MSAVLDASAVLALLFDEPGAEAVADVIADGATISAINLAEVATVLIRNRRDLGATLDPVRAVVAVEPFTDADALAAAALYPAVSAKGLSLGDRTCLALARRLDAPAVTTEHTWTELSLDVAVHLIRAR